VLFAQGVEVSGVVSQLLQLIRRLGISGIK